MNFQKLCISVKTTVPQRLVGQNVYPIDVMENSTFKTELPEDGDDKHRKAFHD